MLEHPLVDALQPILLAVESVEVDVSQMQRELVAFKKRLRVIMHDLNRLIVANGGSDMPLTESEDEWTCFSPDAATRHGQSGHFIRRHRSD